jgi:hypothetical protein
MLNCDCSLPFSDPSACSRCSLNRPLTSGYVHVHWECPYRSACSDNGVKCESCKHSPKHSYFEPYVPVTYTTTSTHYEATT